VSYCKIAESYKETVTHWKLSDALGPIARWNHGDMCHLLGPRTLAHSQVMLSGRRICLKLWLVKSKVTLGKL